MPIAAAQIASNPADSLATAKKAAATLRKAAAKGAMLVAFCEALIAGETTLYAGSDPTEIAGAKFDFDTTAHYARPDIFNFAVDTRAKSSAKEL